MRIWSSFYLNHCIKISVNHALYNKYFIIWRKKEILRPDILNRVQLIFNNRNKTPYQTHLELQSYCQQHLLQQDENPSSGQHIWHISTGDHMGQHEGLNIFWSTWCNKSMSQNITKCEALNLMFKDNKPEFPRCYRPQGFRFNFQHQKVSLLKFLILSIFHNLNEDGKSPKLHAAEIFF